MFHHLLMFLVDYSFSYYLIWYICGSLIFHFIQLTWIWTKHTDMHISTQPIFNHVSMVQFNQQSIRILLCNGNGDLFHWTCFILSLFAKVHFSVLRLYHSIMPSDSSFFPACESTWVHIQISQEVFFILSVLVMVSCNSSMIITVGNVSARFLPNSGAFFFYL